MKLWSSVLRSFAVTAAFALVSVAAHAQIGLYLNPVANHITNSAADSGPYAFLGQNATSRMFYGVDMGGYYDFFQMANSPAGIKAGLDVRDTIVHGASAGLNSFLVGLRLSAKPIATMPLRVYVQPDIGVGSSHSATSSLRIARVQYGVYAGADYTIARHVDFRVVEIGYGSVSTVSSGTVGATAAIPSSDVLSVSSGLVFRFR